MNCFKLFPAVSPMLLLLGVAWAMPATADTVTNVDISSYYSSNTWATEINGNEITAAPTNGNTGTGLTFADWSGEYNITDTGDTTTISIPDIALNGDADVNTLINTFYGSSGIQAVVTFTNSDGAVATYSLVGDQTIRDYNNAIYANDLQGYNSDPTLGDVTAQNWWGDGSDGQRLDAQTFVLPSGWAGTALVSMTIDNPSDSNSDTVLSALQVDDRSLTPPAATPEPSSLLLLGSTVLGAAGIVRRRARALVS